MSDSGSLIDRIRTQVDALTPEEIREQYAALKARREQDLVKAKERRENATPEQKAAAAARYKEYSQKPETKVKAKEYRDRPEVKEKSKAREAERRAKNAAILAKAKELGIEG